MAGDAGPRIAVVVPVFERPTAVLEALESVASQRRRPDALVVVDDGSGDETAERVRKWIHARPSLPAELVTQSNRGVSVARNRGVEAAGDPDWVAFLDSDDLWPEEYLEAHEATLLDSPDAVASSCDKESLDVPSGRTRRVRRDWVAADATLRIARRGPPGVSNTLIRVAEFRALGGFDAGLRTAEDLDLMLRLSLRGPWLYVSGTTARYRHRLGETRGEAASLGHVHEDRRRTRAEVLDAFGATVARERPALVAEIRGLAGRQWANAGRHLQARGRGPEAIDCFDRAVAARAFDLRSRWARRRSARSTAG